MLSSSKKMCLLSVLSIALLLQTAVASNPLFHTCSSSSGNFSNYSSYQASLDKLLTFLYVKAPPTGFALHSVNYNPHAAGNDSYTTANVNGLALCRGDVSSSDCKSCIAKANNDIRTLCPNQKEAVVWYDFCLVKYSNVDFFGHVDNRNKFSLVNVNTVKEADPALFNSRTRALLDRLAAEASRNATLFFAGGETVIEDYGSYGSSSNKTTVYGMVQCTRDLSSSDCKACLDEAISELPTCCSGKQGGRVVGASCSVHYEIYPFLQS